MSQREALKAELIAQIQHSKDAVKLLEVQGAVLNQLKERILKDIAKATPKKTVSHTNFLGLTIRKVAHDNMEILESLQSDLRVILGYEELIQQAQNGADVAKMNLEVLNSKA